MQELLLPEKRQERISERKLIMAKKWIVSRQAELNYAADMRLLSSSTLTVDLEPSLVEQLTALAKPKNVSRGDFLFFPGDRADFLYFVLEGRIKVYLLNQDGRECVIRVADPGDTLCLTSVFGRRIYQYIGAAICRCRVLALSVSGFIELTRSEPDLTANVLRILSRRLEGICRKQCLARNLPAPAQVAHYIIERSAGCAECRHCPLDLRPLQVTAQEIGIARETLSRIIRRMKKEGMIDCCRGCVTIRNPRLIEDIACYR